LSAIQLLEFELQRLEQAGGLAAMLIAGAVVILFIVGLFLEMLSSSPKSGVEWESDTDREPNATPEAAETPSPVLQA